MNRITFKDYFENYYLPSNTAWDTKTIGTKEMVARHYVLPVIGDIPMKDITWEDICRVHECFHEMNHSVNYENTLSSLLEKSFSLAVSMGVIIENPYYPDPDAKRPGYPYVRPKERAVDWYSPGELKTLLEAVKKDRLRYMYQLCFGTGLRSKEVQALSVDDYDPDSHTLHIRRIKKYPRLGKNDWKIVEIPEENCENRFLLLSESAEEAVRKLVLHQKHLESLYGSNRNPDRLLLTGDDGMPLSKPALTLSVKGIRERSGVRKFNLTTIRTNFAVTCLRLGWEPSALMAYIGLKMPANMIPYKKAAEYSLAAFEEDT